MRMSARGYGGRGFEDGWGHRAPSPSSPYLLGTYTDSHNPRIGLSARICGHRAPESGGESCLLERLWDPRMLVERFGNCRGCVSPLPGGTRRPLQSFDWSGLGETPASSVLQMNRGWRLSGGRCGIGSFA